jgi:hypothetical protein
MVTPLEGGDMETAHGSKSLIFRKVAMAATATGAVAIGVFAVGAIAAGSFALGALVIGRSAVRRAIAESAQLDPLMLKTSR